MDETDANNVGGFGDWTERFQLRYPSRASAGIFSNMTVENMGTCHSLTLEFYGACGGIFRYFPRGRSKMPLVFRSKKPGEIRFYLVVRDKNLQTLATRGGKLMVVASQDHIAADMAQGDLIQSDAGQELLEPPVLDEYNKPPMAETDQAQAQQPPSTASSSIQSLAQDAGNSLQDRLEKRLLNRFNKD